MKLKLLFVLVIAIAAIIAFNHTAGAKQPNVFAAEYRPSPVLVRQASAILQIPLPNFGELSPWKFDWGFGDVLPQPRSEVRIIYALLIYDAKGHIIDVRPADDSGLTRLNRI